MILETFSLPILSIKLKIAECSESTGRILALFWAASFFIKFPAITIASLFARARSILFSRTIFEGNKPALPAIPFTTMSGFASSINFWKAFSVLFSQVSREGQLYFFESSSSFSLFECAWIPQTSKSSGIFSAIAKALVPIEPVQPNTKIFFIC